MSLENTNIDSLEKLVTPQILKQEFATSDAMEQHIDGSRGAIRSIIERTDKRVMLVVGPCSIHDEKLAYEYAEKLNQLSKEVAEQILIVMRVYFEKPRTTVGWKGLINDPDLDGSFQIEKGLALARSIMLEINALGLPIANEALDPISPQYLQDLVSWSAIGARTTESQTHREMASGLSVPIGFKNGTDGSLEVAINALQSVSQPHSFLGIDHLGQVSVIHSAGNPHAHIVLRGGRNKPNFDSVNIALTELELERCGLAKNIMIDCSHENSFRKPELQPKVLENILQQKLEGNQSVFGAMLESNLKPGNQKLNGRREDLDYGVSITDGCIDWKTTENSILSFCDRLASLNSANHLSY